METLVERRKRNLASDAKVLSYLLNVYGNSYKKHVNIADVMFGWNEDEQKRDRLCSCYNIGNSFGENFLAENGLVEINLEKKTMKWVGPFPTTEMGIELKKVINKRAKEQLGNGRKKVPANDIVENPTQELADNMYADNHTNQEEIPANGEELPLLPEVEMSHDMEEKIDTVEDEKVKRYKNVEKKLDVLLDNQKTLLDNQKIFIDNQKIIVENQKALENQQSTIIALLRNPIEETSKKMVNGMIQYFENNYMEKPKNRFFDLD